MVQLFHPSAALSQAMMNPRLPLGVVMGVIPVAQPASKQETTATIKACFFI